MQKKKKNEKSQLLNYCSPQESPTFPTEPGKVCIWLLLQGCLLKIRYRLVFEDRKTVKG